MAVHGRLAPTIRMPAMYESARGRIGGLGREAIRRKIETAKEVMVPLAPLQPDLVRTEAGRTIDPEIRRAFFRKTAGNRSSQTLIHVVESSAG